MVAPGFQSMERARALQDDAVSVKGINWFGAEPRGSAPPRTRERRMAERADACPPRSFNARRAASSTP